jgi:hypothetical protein
MSAFSKILVAAALVTGMAAPAFAQASDSESTTGSVRIIQPINLTKVNNLAFGTVVRPASGSSTITMSTSSDTPTVDSGTAVVLSGGTKTRASYTVTGEGGQAVSISVPANFDMTAGANTITVTLTPEATSDTLSGTLGTTGGFSGDGTLYVGGSFAVTNSTVSGDYTGSFSTTVAYN